MSTEYYPILPHLKNVRVEEFPEHWRVTLWDRQGANVGTLCIRVTGEYGMEDAYAMVRAFFHQRPMFHTSATADGTVTIIHPDNPVPVNEYSGQSGPLRK